MKMRAMTMARGGYGMINDTDSDEEHVDDGDEASSDDDDEAVSP